jgi:ribosomal protein S18 acetylase RimI-like enzyme
MRLFRPHPKISLAHPDDAEALAELYERAWRANQGRVDDRMIAEQTPTVGEVAAWLRGGFEVYKAILDGRLVGCVRCSFPTGACLLDRLVVDPTKNREGVGKALAEHAVSRARRAGVARVWLHTSPKLEEAVELFSSLGFSVTGSIRSDTVGEDLLLMELPL